ncbi:hypothetical protein Pla144_26160 [Bythopirellula polymerisocia]|uniref:Uncharacterized protein n=1 Tax=Bythopirellula polymerisocia TaxID=2528003 RepID=A0A5C6CYW6_9BACT|nr:hypothetical protein Pla144_26160 [Bythopirellula polymerisocia]
MGENCPALFITGLKNGGLESPGLNPTQSCPMESRLFKRAFSKKI